MSSARDRRRIDPGTPGVAYEWASSDAIVLVDLASCLLSAPSG